ncbi:MAG: putative component of membrane protein insertase Oxa1/YidC/SpoIIIJ protein YidD [Cyclobacteriaceae bacterium]|jgi:putative component of membrane protein insertase Oxa1/YidC/SpoIIIJ protein YidD
MRILLSGLVFFSTLLLVGQENSSTARTDKELLFTNNSVEQSTEQVKFRRLLKVYNRLFADQLLNDCIYVESCSTFSQGAIKEHGLIKGGFLSADRLMRCNRASAMDVTPVRINNEGKIKDHWDHYRFH